RNIMDHTKGAGAWAAVDGFEDQYYSGRRPTGLYIPRFRNIKEQRRDYLRGFGYQGGAGRGRWRGLSSGNRTGRALKDAATHPGSLSISLSGFGECLPYQENRVVLNEDQKDKYGRPTLTMQVEFKENERVMHKDIADMAGEILEKCGYK